MSCRVMASRAPKGSSSSSTSRRNRNVRSRASRWRIPPLSSCGHASLEPGEPEAVEQGERPRPCLGRSTPSSSLPSIALSSARRHGSSRSFWGMYAATPGRPRRPGRRSWRAPAVGRQQAGQHPQQRALPAPAGSDEADERRRARPSRSTATAAPPARPPKVWREPAATGRSGLGGHSRSLVKAASTSTSSSTSPPPRGRRRSASTPPRPGGPTSAGVVGVPGGEVLGAGPDQVGVELGRGGEQRVGRGRRVGHGLLVAAAVASMNARATLALPVERVLGGGEHRRVPVGDAVGVVDERDGRHVDALLLEADLVPAVEDPDEVVLVPLEADPVVDVADLGEVDRRRDRRRRTSTSFAPAPSRAARRSRRRCGPPGRAGRVMPASASDSRLDVLCWITAATATTGTPSARAGISSSWTVKATSALPPTSSWSGAGVAGLDDLDVEAGVAVPALGLGQVHAAVVGVRASSRARRVTFGRRPVPTSPRRPTRRRPRPASADRRRATRAVRCASRGLQRSGSGDGGRCHGEARRASEPTAANSRADSTATTTTATKMRSTWKLDLRPVDEDAEAPVAGDQLADHRAGDGVGGGDAQAGEERRDRRRHRHDPQHLRRTGAHAPHQLDQLGVGAGQPGRRC